MKRFKEYISEKFLRHLKYTGFQNKQYEYDMYKNPTKEEMKKIWEHNDEPLGFIDVKTSVLYVANYQYEIHNWMVKEVPELKGKTLISIRIAKGYVQITDSNNINQIPRKMLGVLVRKNTHLKSLYNEGYLDEEDTVGIWDEAINGSV